MSNLFTNSFSESIWSSTYKDKLDKDVLHTFRRLAKFLASVEKDPEYWEEEFFKVLNNFSFLTGGRIMSNAGTGHLKASMINCFVSGPSGYDIDSMEGILGELRNQALILRSEGGYGFNCDFMRPRGAFIEGIGAESPGPVKLLEMWDTQSAVITSGSGTKKNDKGKEKIRKGAQMVVMSVWHPSIKEFITAKQTPGVLTKFNMSVLISDTFMEYVEEDRDWDLMFPNTTHEKYKEEWDGNLEKWLSKGYPVNVYETVKAKELWDLITKSTYNRNEPGILFGDTINKNNNLWYCEHISATNPCLAKGTKVNTPFGYKNIEDVKVGDLISTLGPMGYEPVNDIEVHKDYPICKVTFSDGGHLLATESHQFYVILNNKASPIMLKNINIGDSVLVSPNKIKGELDLNSKAQVVSIEPFGKSDVYDLHCVESDTWITEGYVSRGCGEQMLPIGGVCLLGSINLTQFVKDQDWDYDKLAEYIPIIVRMMDNVNDLTYVPLPEQQESIKNKRRIGLGYMGYGSALMMMKIKYGSPEALKLTEELCSFVTNTAYQSSALLAKEKGSFLLFDKEKYLQSKFVKTLNKETKEYIKLYGIRNSHLTSIQPTGNSSIIANIVSGGQEPVFMPEYYRTSILSVTPEGLELPKKIDWVSKTYDGEGWNWIKEGDESLLHTIKDGITYKFDKSRGLLVETLIEDYAVYTHKQKGTWDKDAEWAQGALSLDIKDHVETMKVFSRYLDSAMSKTINLPNDYSFEKFKDVYLEVYKTGTIKGCTTYREGTMTSVLSSKASQVVESINKSHAPKRPKTLPCDIFHLTANGEKWVSIVGLLGNDPYEVFTIRMSKLKEGSSITGNSGNLVRIKSGHYDLFLEDGSKVEDIVQYLGSEAESALSRIISTSLRHGADVEFVASQLLKSEGSVVSFSKAIARTLKKYFDGRKITTMKCSECNSKNIIMSEGCYKCSDCGSSKCN